MTKEHKRTITVNLVILVENMNMENIMIHLIRDDIVSNQERKEILAEVGEKQAEKFLVDILPKKADSAYKKLIYVLRETRNHQIANVLDLNEAASLTGDLYLCLV